MAKVEHGTLFLISNIKLPDTPRRDMGDLEELAKSMREKGQLQEIVLDGNFELVAGERRLRAAIINNWRHIRCHVLDGVTDPDLLFQCEFDENTQRKPLSPSEAVAQGKRIEEILKPLAVAAKKAGQLAGKDKDGNPVFGETESVSPKNPQDYSNHEKTGKVDNAAAKAAGMGRERYKKAREVTKAAEDDPDNFGAIEKWMNETNNVEGAHKKLKAKQAELEAADDEDDDSPTTKKDELLDALKAPVPSHLRDVFGDKTLQNVADAIVSVLKDIERWKKHIKGKLDWLKFLPAGEIFKAFTAAQGELETARSHLVGNKPHAVCPICGGSGKPDCCRKQGYVPKWRLEELKKQGLL